MNSGLTYRDLETIKNIFRKYPEIERVHLFGSRANGKYKPGSDIDLAIMDTNLSPEIINSVKNEFEESSLPYFVDLVGYASLKHKELIAHIDNIGIEFYKKEPVLSKVGRLHQ